jgi:hypothetical protein
MLASPPGIAFQQPSTNEFYLAEDRGQNYPGSVPVIFSISPRYSQISFSAPHPDTNASDVPTDKVLVQRAWFYAVRLGVDPAQVAFRKMTSFFNKDGNYNDLVNQRSGRGVLLSRRLDGVLFTDLRTPLPIIAKAFMARRQRTMNHRRLFRLSLNWKRLSILATATCRSDCFPPSWCRAQSVECSGRRQRSSLW